VDILSSSKSGFAQRIFLFSDGQDGGTPSGDALFAQVSAWTQQGINVSTFGIGDDFDEKVMRGIANAGAGGFVYISNSTEIPEKVAKGLEALQSLVAKDVSLQIEVSPGFTLSNTYTYTGFSKGVVLGGMSAPDRKQVLLELKVQPGECRESKEGDDRPEEPVAPGEDEKKAAPSQGKMVVSAFKWTLNYVDVATSRVAVRKGEAFATLTDKAEEWKNAAEHASVVVSAVVAESGEKDQVILDLLQSSDNVTRAILIKRGVVAKLKAVEPLDDMNAVTWLLKRTEGTLQEMESRNDIEKMRKNVGYEQYQASQGLQCAGLI